MFPSSEAETIELYRIIQKRIGWRIVEEQKNAFPDAVLESENGERLNCEFEFRSRNFKKHGHPVEGCDLILCWQDNWPDSPLPVMALEDCAKEEAMIIDALIPKMEPYWARWPEATDDDELEIEIGEPVDSIIFLKVMLCFLFLSYLAIGIGAFIAKYGGGL